MNSADLIVRDAHVDDVAALVSLINEAYIVEQFFVTGPRVSEADILTLMEKGTLLVGSSPRNEIVGSVYIEKRGERGYIGLLSVSPAVQGRGIGSSMMESAENRLASEGCVAVDIRVVSLRTELPPFYERLGYRHQGTEAFDDPRKTRACHFLKMSKEIRT
jgi:ribosomal protein S18 acetylase RimI-like enzyme